MSTQPRHSILHYRLDDELLEVPIDKPRVVLGRSSDCDVVFPKVSSISRRHAVLEWSGDRWRILDAGSSIGTFVNGRRITEPVVLKHRDQIKLGLLPITLICPQPAAPHSVVISDQESIRGFSQTISVDEIKKRLDGKGAAESPQPNRAAWVIDLYDQIGRAMLAGQDLDDILRKILNVVFDNIPAHRGCICLFNPTRGKFEPRVSYLRQGGLAHTIVVSQSIVRAVAESKQSVLANDLLDDDRYSDVSSIRSLNIGSAMGAPLCHNDRVTGLIYVDSQGPAEQFSRHHLEVLTTLSILAAVGVEQTRLREDVIRSHEKMSIMLDLATSVNQTLDLGALIARIIQKTSEILDCDRGSLFLLDRETNELWSMKAGDAEISEIRFPADSGLAGHAATTGEIVNVQDPYNDPRFNREVDKQTGYRTRNVLSVPVRGRDDEVIGVVQAINKFDGHFERDDEELMTAVSAQISIALENAQLYKRTVEMRNYLRSVQESISNGIITLDNSFRVVTANQAALRLFAADSEKFQKTDVRAFLKAENPHMLELIDRVHRGGQSVVEYNLELTLPGMESNAVNVNIVPLINNQERSGMVVIVEDVTQEKRIKSTLTRYMSSDIVEKMLADSEKQTLGGVRSRASVVFTDIRKFTTIAEGLSAEETMDFLNEYFTLMVDRVVENRGVVDKFIGDAMMAVFGVPYAQDDDAVRAVRSAVSMIEELSVYNERRQSRGLPEIEIGIGVNTDEVISGNMGSEKRMDYTVIGDGVNTASRLEGLTKAYGVDILISEATRAELGDEFATRPLDHVVVKGKTHPVEVFEVLGTSPDCFTGQHQQFVEAVMLYRQRQFEQAREMFQSLSASDPASKVYCDRCSHFIDNAPPDDWDGVWVFLTK